MKPYLLLFCLSCIIGCQKETDPPVNPGITAQTFSNVAYGSDPKQVMDVYLPEGRSTATTKVAILIHPGAWATGDKSDFNQYVDTLKKRVPDYAIFNINYRLANALSNHFPTQENDVKAAVEFIVSKSAEYKISQKIVLLGASAGGHLATLYGYKYSTPVKVKAIIDFFGPTDMVAMHNQPVDPSTVPALQVLMGGTPASNPTMYQQSSPINFVTAQSPPTLILQGGVDPLVAVTQSTALDAKLQTMGVAHEYIYYPTEGHGWFGTNLHHSFNAIQAFLATHVN